MFKTHKKILLILVFSRMTTKTKDLVQNIVYFREISQIVRKGRTRIKLKMLKLIVKRKKNWYIIKGCLIKTSIK